MIRREFYKQTLERVRNLPGVQRAGVLTDLLVRGYLTGSIAINDGPAVPVGTLGYASVGPGLFETLDVPLIRGRFFSDDDVLTQIRLLSTSLAEAQKRNLAWPAIVNEAFVRRFLADVDPLSARFRLGGEVLQVVGVVGDMHREGPERPAIAEFFRPYIGFTSEMAVRTSSDPFAVAASVRAAIRSVNPQAMVLSATSLDRRLAELGAPRQAQTWLLAAFAVLALALAAIGIYGIVRYRVSERRREIAIRIAIGARASDVLREVIGQGMVAPMLGLAIGILGALWITQVMSHQLFEISPTDSVTFLMVGATLACAGMLACWIPARRASRVDPIEALRCE
jgi:putative ABC transport system permease protein